MRRLLHASIVISIIILASLQINLATTKGVIEPTIDLLPSSSSNTDYLDLTQSIQRNTRKVDVNSNKIADYLEDKSGQLDLILVFEDFQSMPKSINIQGLEIISKYDRIPAIRVKADASIIKQIARLPGLAIVEENLPLQKYLAYSTAQVGVRPYLWDMGLTGKTDFSIAIVDSGIDTTQQAFDGRIVATYNALNNNATPALDFDGHGTHVAGIAAGLPSTSTTYTQTSRGKLPNGTSFYLDILWANVNTSTTINVGMDWGGIGADNPGGTAYVALVKWDAINQGFVLACSSCQAVDTTGLIDTSFSILTPGDYYVGFGNDGGADNKIYEGWAELTFDSQLPSEKNTDGYEQYSGIAPSSKIVAIKVIDENGNGNTNTFLTAMQWIIANKLIYNITVVNLSIGIEEYSVAIDSQITDLTNAGIIAVVAAGNSGGNSGGIFSPGSAEEAITVGAVNRYNEVAFYSSNGATATGVEISKPDVVAPGGSPLLPFLGSDSSYPEGLGLIVAPDSNLVGYNVKNNDFVGYQGTSMATPHVSGLAALLVQKIAEDGSWSWSSSDVFRVKRAILAGTFEVANIGSAGGEGTTTFPNQQPTLDRTTKDFVEGWGAVNGLAAYNALSKPISINKDIIRTVALEDPFTSNVYAWNFNVKAGTSYQFQVQVPTGADVDLLVFSADTGLYGDLNLLYSATTTTLGSSESITIQETQDTKIILVVRLVDSVNPTDIITVKLLNPDFIPDVFINDPTDGSFVNSSSINVDFDSVTDLVDVYLDNVYLGEKEPGFLLTGLAEGIHNLTLIEKNTITNVIAKVESLFTVDLTNPILISDFASLDGTSFSNSLQINFTATDNIALDRIEITVGNIQGSVINLNGTSVTSQITLNPTSFPNGDQTIYLILYDKSGNRVIENIQVTLTHSIFLFPHSDIILEADDSDSSITWDASSNNPSTYSIFVDSLAVVTKAWDGKKITFQITNLSLGTHSIELQIFNTNGQSVSDVVKVTIQDTIKPRITSPEETIYDATVIQTIQFVIIDALPAKLTIYKNDSIVILLNPWDGNNSDAITKVTGVPGEKSNITVVVEDSSGNQGINQFIMMWEDLTSPVVMAPDDLTFDEGKASNDLIWSWVELYLVSATLKLDGKLLAEVKEGESTSVKFSQANLNQLSPGTYKFTIDVLDQGGVKISKQTTLIVNGKETKSSFLYFSSLPIIIYSLVAISIIIKKRK